MRARLRLARARCARAVLTFLALVDTSRRALACRAMHSQPVAAPVQPAVARSTLASGRSVEGRASLDLHARAPLLLLVIFLPARSVEPTTQRACKMSENSLTHAEDKECTRKDMDRDARMGEKAGSGLRHGRSYRAGGGGVSGPKSSVRPDPGGGAQGVQGDDRQGPLHESTPSILRHTC